jgi:hypothetical protein
MASDNASIKHEVAFSFVKGDLAQAQNFADSLAPLSTFVYSRKQEEIAGTDGLDSFRAAFRFDSRLNVILLRRGWGETPWTRVEQTAIQDRCLADGWDRLLVVCLDGSPTPRWIPETNLYLDMQAFPFEQAVGAIKRQVQYLGGKPTAPSPLDAARAIARLAKFDSETKDLFRTPDGIAQADAAVIRIGESLNADLLALAPDNNWTVNYGRENAGYCVVRLQGASVLINWHRYANTADDCDLTVRIIPAAFETPAERLAGKYFMRFGKEHATFERIYKAHRTMAHGVCWRCGRDIFTSEQIAGELLTKLIEAVIRS